MEYFKPHNNPELAVQKDYLAFATTGANNKEWMATADRLSKRLAAEFTAQGFETDYEICKYPGMQDWEFLARGHGCEFIVILVAYGQPNQWQVLLRDFHHYTQPANPQAKALAIPIIESTIKTWPGVTDWRWHANIGSVSNEE